MPSTPVGRRAAHTLTAVSCVALLSACGGSDAAPAREQAAPRASGGEAPSRGQDRSAAWPGGSDDRDVLARHRVSLGLPEDAPPSVRPTADLLVRGLTVRGRVATLRVTAVVHGWEWSVSRADREAGKRAPYPPDLSSIDPGATVYRQTSASLVDPVNLRLHRPLQDSEGEAVASMAWASGGSGEGRPIEASWMFAAPPEGVDAMDVQVGGFPVFREVPVTRR